MEIAIHHQKHPAINKTVNNIIYFALFNNIKKEKKHKNKLLNNLFIILCTPSHVITEGKAKKAFSVGTKTIVPLKYIYIKCFVCVFVCISIIAIIKYFGFGKIKQANGLFLYNKIVSRFNNYLLPF